MESEGLPPDDLDVRLQWPGGNPDPVSPGESGRQPEEQSDPGEQPAISTGSTSSTDLALMGRVDVTHAALASIAMRLDALTSATAALRSLFGDRLTDYGEHVARVQASSSRDLEELRRLHERTLAQIDTSLNETEEAIRRLDRAAGTLLSRFDDLDGSVGDRLDRLSQHFETLTTQLADRPDVDLTPLTTHLQHLEALTTQFADRPQPDLDELARVLAEVRERLQPAPVADPASDPAAIHAASVTAALERLEHAISGLAARDAGPDEDSGELDHVRDTLERLATAQAADLERVLEAIEEIGRRETPASHTDMASGFARLDAKMEGLPTGSNSELVDLVAQLNTRVDELAEQMRSGTDLSAVDKAVSRLDRKLDVMAKRPSEPTPAAGGAAILAAIEALTAQVETLRRRIALRGRQGPLLDAAALETVAEAVARKLAPVPPMAEVPPASERRRGRRA
jgi:hypothetical protein